MPPTRAALPNPDDPGRAGWYWERLKAHIEEEFYNPGKFDANCKGARAGRRFCRCCC
jgi:hypothetical protein